MKINHIEFETCNFTDADHCAALCELEEIYMRDPMGGGTPHNDRQKLHLLDGIESHPRAVAIFILEDNRIAGLAVAFINFSTFHAKPMMNLHDIVIRPEFRGHGLGRLLLQKMEEIAREKGCAKITLEVREDNAEAQRLYEKEGFHDTEPRMLFKIKTLV